MHGNSEHIPFKHKNRLFKVMQFNISAICPMLRIADSLSFYFNFEFS